MIDFAHFAPGQVFARRYAIVRLIKAGGMGAVYEATHLQTRRRVAVKVMRPEIVADPTERARFVQEAQVATLIESAHVVDVLDAGVDDDTQVPFLVMEYLVGEELGDLLRRVPRLPPADVVSLLSQAARALDKAHARGVVHRDLKPENMFLALRDEATTLKILDFGIAKVLQSASASSTRGTGTPLYMAPEQTRRSSQIGPSTDVWALGLVAYRMLVGHSYWLADDVHQLLGEVLVEPLESPTERARARGVILPTTFDAWFFACVNRDPSARYARAGGAVSALAAVFGVEGHAPSRPSSMPNNPIPATAATIPSNPHELALAETTASPQTRDDLARGLPRRTPLIAGIVVAACALIVGGGFAMRAMIARDEPAPPTATTTATATTSEVPSAKPHVDTLAEKIEATNAWITVDDDLQVEEHEVTREEYARFVSAAPKSGQSAVRPIDGWQGEAIDAASRRRPVTWVTYERAERFCRAIGGRLPSSEEWGRALGKTYPWGDVWPPSISDLAIGRGDDASPIDVETTARDRTPLGVYDLAGNVQEWTVTPGGQSGTRLVRGASVSMIADDAKLAITAGFAKFSENAVPLDAQPTLKAGARLGFRCVRTPSS